MSRSQPWWWFVGLLLAVLVLAGLSVLIGAGSVGPGRVFDVLRGRADGQAEMVVTTLRLPRTLVALMIGCALGVAGALLQAVTRNPLAETGLLGVNAGAALGVVTGIAYAHAETGYAYLAWAFGGALIASVIVLVIASTGRASMSPLRLVLAGAALGATFRGVMSYILISDQTSYDQFRFWQLGSLSGVTGEMARKILPAVLAGLVIALLAARPLSALALGDDAARALGHRPRAIRISVTIAVTLLTAASVAIAGPISFLGLLAPYVARAIAGPRMFTQLLLSALTGAVILLGADILARVVVRPSETSVAVLLAVLGAPVLIGIARSRRLLVLGS